MRDVSLDFRFPGCMEIVSTSRHRVVFPGLLWIQKYVHHKKHVSFHFQKSTGDLVVHGEKNKQQRNDVHGEKNKQQRKYFITPTLIYKTSI
jgi:hypothetical protein